MTNAHLSSVEAPSGEWSPAFRSQREPFAPDNRAAMTHGSYARLSDEPETQRIADDVRDSLAPYAPVDEVLVQAQDACEPQIIARHCFRWPGWRPGASVSSRRSAARTLTAPRGAGGTRAVRHRVLPGS